MIIQSISNYDTQILSTFCVIFVAFHARATHIYVCELRGWCEIEIG